MKARGKGYSTLFRELGTPEGDFHATFVNHNKKLRKELGRLASLFPSDPNVADIVERLEKDRAALWVEWKRGGLSASMRRVVNSVRVAHHGPHLEEQD